jgi:SAM-dependent methyltransferase
MKSGNAIQYENRFGPAVDAFQAFRPAYPPEVFLLIQAEVPEGRRERAIDVGSGTGLSALPLCELFQEVIAVEPDPQMAAALPGRHARLSVRISTAEDCDLPAGCADLVSFGTSFHWMDGPRVLEHARNWLRKSGLLIIYSYPVPRLSGPIQAVVQREFDLHWNSFRHPRLNDQGYTERTFLEHSGMGCHRILKIPNVVYFSPEEAVGFARSTSYGSAYIRSLENPGPYLQELLESFREAARGESIAADFSLSVFLGIKD